jgi:hypothetical protein
LLREAARAFIGKFLAGFLAGFLAAGGMPIRTINRALRRKILYMLRRRVAP